ATRFLIAAENGLKKNQDSCPPPYSRVALRDTVTLDGQPAAELEYTCGSGERARHGLWRAAVISKKAYGFFLTVEADQFDAYKPIYLEAVRSYHLPTV